MEHVDVGVPVLRLSASNLSLSWGMIVGRGAGRRRRAPPPRRRRQERGTIPLSIKYFRIGTMIDPSSSHVVG